MTYDKDELVIKRPEIEIVDFYEDSEEKIACCSHCLKFGFIVPLKNRIYPEGQPVPVDHDQWKQCHECGLIVPIYELQRESEIKDVVETIDNAFDIGKSFLGVDNRTSVSGKNARKKRERQKQLDDIKDDDLKRELAKGNTLISYIEYQPQ